MEFLGNPLNQFLITTALAILSIVITYIIFLIQRSKKRISYAIVSKKSLLQKNKYYNDELELSYNNRSVKNVQILVLRVWNSGRVPISPSDFIVPITFKFGTQAEVLIAEIIKIRPLNLVTSVRQKLNSIELVPVLLNNRDAIKIKAIVAQCAENIEVDGRIAGIKKVVNANSRMETLQSFLLASTCMTGFMLLIYVILSIILLLSILHSPQVLYTKPYYKPLIGSFVLIILSFIALTMNIIIFIIYGIRWLIRLIIW